MCTIRMAETLWWILLFCTFTDIIAAVRPSLQVLRSHEICEMHNGRRVYVEMDDRGELRASNVNLWPNKVIDLNRAGTVLNATTVQSQCTIELITCPSCIFKVSLTFTNFTTQCDYPGDLPCRCDYLWLSEPPYDANAHGKRLCGAHNANIVYESKTRTLLIKFIYQTKASHPFTLEYTAERNCQSINGNLGDLLAGLDTEDHVIASPFFPNYYPRDFAVEHIFACAVDGCRVRILFTDFIISPSSTMEVFESDDHRLDVYNGMVFRPPVIVSSGQRMKIRFFGNGGTGLGFRARVSFFQSTAPTSSPVPLDSQILPNTDCGGQVETLGGAITMMDMLTNVTEVKVYDCVWLIRPPSNYLHLKTHLSLRVQTFQKLAGPSELIIRQGLTSDRPELDTLKWSAKQSSGQMTVLRSKSFVVALKSGFYVSLRGVFNSETRLAIVYSAFSYTECFLGSEFLCQNHRCIPFQLQCDGFDHCGDGSDEPNTCTDEWKTERYDRRWYMHTPNYYFPKSDRYPDMKTATAVFVISCLGLILLCSSLIILLFRMGTRVRHQREIQNHLQTISELLEGNGSHTEEISSDEPPIYEAPPDYEEVIKIGMETQLRKSRRRRMIERKRLNRERSTSQSDCGYDSSIVNVATNSTVDVLTEHATDLPCQTDLLLTTQPIQASSSSVSGIATAGATSAVAAAAAGALIAAMANTTPVHNNSIDCVNTLTINAVQDEPLNAAHREQDFFMASRILEAPTSSTLTETCHNSRSSQTTPLPKSPPPPYHTIDQQPESKSSQIIDFILCESELNSSQNPDRRTQGYANDTLNVSLAVSMSTPLSAEEEECNAHLWTDCMRHKKLWQLFRDSELRAGDNETTNRNSSSQMLHVSIDSLPMESLESYFLCPNVSGASNGSPKTVRSPRRKARGSLERVYNTSANSDGIANELYNRNCVCCTQRKIMRAKVNMEWRDELIARSSNRTIGDQQNSIGRRVAVTRLSRGSQCRRSSLDRPFRNRCVQLVLPSSQQFAGELRRLVRSSSAEFLSCDSSNLIGNELMLNSQNEPLHQRQVDNSVDNLIALGNMSCD